MKVVALFSKSFSPGGTAMSLHDILRKERVTANKSQLDQHSAVQFVTKHSLCVEPSLNRFAEKN